MDRTKQILTKDHCHVCKKYFGLSKLHMETNHGTVRFKCNNCKRLEL